MDSGFECVYQTEVEFEFGEVWKWVLNYDFLEKK